MTIFPQTDAQCEQSEDAIDFSKSAAKEVGAQGRESYLRETSHHAPVGQMVDALVPLEHEESANGSIATSQDLVDIAKAACERIRTSVLLTESSEL